MSSKIYAFKKFHEELLEKLPLDNGPFLLKLITEKVMSRNIYDSVLKENSRASKVNLFIEDCTKREAATRLQKLLEIMKKYDDSSVVELAKKIGMLLCMYVCKICIHNCL